ncbi:zf-HC2 domain-containing protein [Streptomyces sp. NBC_00820]|uniref:zf-HC2 domain-containing protein n=1 Tax=Streptomyces sp. NBC_00820 TaxID=2975842 RepID=UPI002ED1FF9A|nr:zf-HC2 domain-containing protein [Streptomyces sp. NBC_00820]
MTNNNAHIWHADDGVVARYAAGSLPEPDAWSLETHVEQCSRCAVRVSRAVGATAAGTVLREVREAVLGALPAQGAAQGSARIPASGAPACEGAAGQRRPGLPKVRRLPRLRRTARLLWAAGPAVRGAWLPAVLVVAAGALVLGQGGGFAGTRALLLAIAPVVPVAGVALSYGPHADPLYEVAAASPGGGLRLALTRTLVVLAVSLPLLTLTGLLLPASGAPAAAAWLLPGLALTLTSLALASFVGCRTATGVTAGGWLCAVLAPTATAPAAITARLAEQLSQCLDGAGAQGTWAAAAAVSAVLLAVRRQAFDNLLPR